MDAKRAHEKPRDEVAVTVALREPAGLWKKDEEEEEKGDFGSSHGAVIPSVQLVKAQTKWLSFPWFRDHKAAKEYSHYRDFSDPSIFLVLFAFIYTPELILRCNLYNIPTYNTYWGISFFFTLLVSFVVYVHIGLLVLAKLEQEGRSTRFLLGLLRICRAMKSILEMPGLSLPDLLVVVGEGSVGFGLLGRVANGICPSDVNLWSSQWCNPDANSRSIPTDTVAVLYVAPLCIMVFFPGTSFQAIVAGYFASMAFLTAVLVQVGGFLQSYTVFFYGFAYVLCIVEVERLWRVSFLERKTKICLLNQLFPETLVPKLIKGEHIDPTTHDNVCVFFSDICNFTELTHELGPLGTRSLVDAIMLIMDQCTQRCPGVWKVERVGDGYVCECGVVFGGGGGGGGGGGKEDDAASPSSPSPSRLQRNCATMLDFALLVRAEVSKITNPMTGLPLMLRIGIHCGSCAAGLVGNQKLMPHFSLFGDLINCTARLETTSTPNMIHVSEDVVLALRDCGTTTDGLSKFYFSQRGVVDLKGLGKMTTYWLLGYLDDGEQQQPQPQVTRSFSMQSLGSSADAIEISQSSSQTDLENSILDYKFDVRSVPEDVEALTNVLFDLLCRLFDLNRIGINPVTLRNFIKKVGEAYKDVPYHNFHHSWCVAQMTAALYYHNVIAVYQLRRSLEMAMFASMIAVICHDVGHDGRNNTFHVNSKSPLAKTFFNQSPLENYHIGVTNAILGTHACNVFENWTFAFAEFARHLISNSLLATDMKLHDDVLADLAQYDPSLLESTKINFDPAPESVGMLSFNVEQYELLRLSRLMLHAADISNSVRPFDISAAFVNKLASEFGRQVEEEKKQQLPVTAFMVIPNEVAKAKGELYFLKCVSRPYFVALAKSFPACSCLVDTLDENVASWEALVAANTATG